MTLGICTLLTYVPTSLGVAHQAGGVLVLSAATNLLHIEVFSLCLALTWGGGPDICSKFTLSLV